MKKISDATNQTTPQLIDVFATFEKKCNFDKKSRQHPKLTLTEPQGKLKI